MPKPTAYVVSFSPAEKTSHSFRVAISLLTAGVSHEITATNFRDLESEVRRLAAEFGQSCSPYIRLKDRNARTPNGFRKWRDTVQFIEYQQKETA